MRGRFGQNSWAGHSKSLPNWTGDYENSTRNRQLLKRDPLLSLVEVRSTTDGSWNAKRKGRSSEIRSQRPCQSSGLFVLWENEPSFQHSSWFNTGIAFVLLENCETWTHCGFSAWQGNPHSMRTSIECKVSETLCHLETCSPAPLLISHQDRLCIMRELWEMDTLWKLRKRSLPPSIVQSILKARYEKCIYTIYSRYSNQGPEPGGNWYLPKPCTNLVHDIHMVFLSLPAALIMSTPRKNYEK